MNDALIGATGFVGGTLLAQRPFAHRYRSTDIAAIRGGRFALVACAGAPAQKWLANREPERDAEGIRSLVSHLEHVRCERFVLLSTVDVFADPRGVDERSPVVEQELAPYGRHRLMLERFVQERFADALIVRLAGLVGPGLRKNVVFDLHNDNNLAAVDHRAVYQFYPMVNLWTDIATALDAGLGLVHLSAAPLAVAEVASEGFGREFEGERPAAPPRYDFRSRHAALFGGSGDYQYSRRESLLAIRAYAQSEPRRPRA